MRSAGRGAAELPGRHLQTQPRSCLQLTVAIQADDETFRCQRRPALQGDCSGASRIRTGDLLGAIQSGCAASNAPERALYQRFCMSGPTVSIPLDANGYAPICRVSATSGQKWLKSSRAGWKQWVAAPCRKKI